MPNFNLYEDDISSLSGSPNGGNNDSDILIEIDLGEKSTLFDLCKPIRDYLSDKPEDLKLTVYLVCGMTSSSDASLFIDFLKTVSNPISIVFRGVIHISFIELFLRFDDVVVIPGSTFRFSEKDLHQFMKKLLAKPELYRNFIQRYSDQYWKLKEGDYIDIDELILLGIKLQKL